MYARNDLRVVDILGDVDLECCMLGRIVVGMRISLWLGSVGVACSILQRACWLQFILHTSLHLSIHVGASAGAGYTGGRERNLTKLSQEGKEDASVTIVPFIFHIYGARVFRVEGLAVQRLPCS